MKAKYKISKRKQAKGLSTISVVYFVRNPLVYRKIFTDDYYLSGYFRRTGTIHPGIFGGRALSIRVFSADGHYPSGYFRRTGTIHPGIFGRRALSIRVFSANGHYLTIILRNRAEYRLILSRRGRRPSRLKSDDIPRD